MQEHLIRTSRFKVPWRSLQDFRSLGLHVEVQGTKHCEINVPYPALGHIPRSSSREKVGRSKSFLPRKLLFSLYEAKEFRQVVYPALMSSPRNKFVKSLLRREPLAKFIHTARRSLWFVRWMEAIADFITCTKPHTPRKLLHTWSEVAGDGKRFTPAEVSHTAPMVSWLLRRKELPQEVCPMLGLSYRANRSVFSAKLRSLTGQLAPHEGLYPGGSSLSLLRWRWVVQTISPCANSVGASANARRVSDPAQRALDRWKHFKFPVTKEDCSYLTEGLFPTQRAGSTKRTKQGLARKSSPRAKCVK